MKSRCRICREPVAEMTKRYDEALGFVCPECHSFLLSAEKVLKRKGIQGVTLKPKNS